MAGLRYDPADIRLRVTAALVAVNEAATLIDSGANAHLTSDKSLFTGFVRSCRQSVGGIDSSSTMYATGVGKGELRCSGVVIPLQRLYYVKNLGKTLISTSVLVDAGFSIMSKLVNAKNTTTVWLDDQCLASVSAVNGLYCLERDNVCVSSPAVWEDDLCAHPSAMGFVATKGGKLCANLLSNNASLATLLHKRCGHISLKNGAVETSLRAIFGSKFCPGDMPVCDACVMSKMTRFASKAARTRKATRPLERVHFDLSPSIPVKGLGGQIGYLALVDEYTSMYFVKFIFAKSEVPEILRDFKKAAEVHFQENIGVFVEGKVPKLAALRSDNAAEHVSSIMSEWCRKEGIKHEFSAPYSAWQNGRVERAIRTLWEGSEAMRKAAGAPDRYWPLSLDAFVHVRNRMPLRDGGKSPYEAWNNIVVPLADRIKHLRVWGCLAYLLVHKGLRKKLDDKARRCIFLGYSPEHKAYRLLDLATGKFHVGVSVMFDEDTLPMQSWIGGVQPVRGGPAIAPDTPLVLNWEDFSRPIVVSPVDGADDSVADDGDATVVGDEVVGGGCVGDLEVLAGHRSPGASANPPLVCPPVLEDMNEGAVAADKYLVDRLVGHRVRQYQDADGVDEPWLTEEFKVRWQGYGRRYDSWQASSDVHSSDVQRYVEKCAASVSSRRARYPGRVLDVDYVPPASTAVSGSSGGGVGDVSQPLVEDVQAVALCAAIRLNAGGGDTSALSFTLEGKPVVPDVVDSLVGLRVKARLAGPPLSRPDLHRLRRRIDLLAMVASKRDVVPSRFNQVGDNINHGAWMEAMRTELGNFEDFGVWKLVHLPLGANKMSCRWVYAVKRDKAGAFKKLKARLCVRGFSQKAGVDYSETWAPTARMRCLRAMLAEASADPGIKTSQWDCTSAFLHAAADCDMYMEQPPGFAELGAEDKVCLLVKSVYGTKQASRLFHQLVRDKLLQIGAVQAEADECLFVIRDGSDWIKIVVHVDDFAITSKGQKLYDKVFAFMNDNFKITDEGELHYFLGLEISREASGDFVLRQAAYIQELLSRIGMSTTAGASTTTPERAGTKGKLRPRQDLSPEEEAFMRCVPYRQAVGGLFYLARATRWDISHACGQVARFMAAPAPEHWHAVLRIYRYLARTIDVPLRLHVGKCLDVVTAADFKAMADADWAGCSETRRSYTGWQVFFGKALVAWCSRRQGMVTQSSTEAEYVAAAAASNELVWWSKLASDFGYRQARMIIECDNKSAVILADHAGKFDASKHVETKFHVLRDRVNAKIQSMSWVPESKMLADVLTKNTQPKVFLNLVSRAMNHSVF